ncbi:FAD-dependent pyridine nucleotide-disulphide oxidoreductase [Alkaliphilus oremlandii OhILAs]|uniref:FAD-dependent pyridine nucleotide-disulphide oxidoreductase n=1 Tax=Alkaliphilus oremlandii (strain OhILAs) TaxID=350688 RepID=A8MEG3_ALKOO|nr:FAD-dependent pyridine nucleotide-disulphide oxidoreductase [Alkaliphilus oremlandii OhILAs]
MAEHVLDKAKQCLQCKNPRCEQGCPINTPIKEMIRLLLEGDIHEAGKMVFENNPLSIVCSLVCPHERQCEGNCIKGIKSNPVKIGDIEHYISDYNLELLDLKPAEKQSGNIGIIGSGPAGITIALILALRGYSVTIFESREKIGGMLRYGIPEFRLSRNILDRIQRWLTDLGVVIRPNTLIGSKLTIDELLRDGFDALFIGTGVWQPKKLDIRGESLGHVHFAIDYLRNPDVYNLGKKVCVIGAGNVAMDVARTAVRKGAKEVTIMYRKGIEEMTATKHEIEYTKIDGVRFELYKAPLEITAEGVIYTETEKIEDEKGVRFATIKGSEKLFQCDSVMIAISQGPRANIISTTTGIEVNSQGLAIVDENGMTTREGVFAAGDVVTGAKTVVNAVKYSKHIADAIGNYVDKRYHENKEN